MASVLRQRSPLDDLEDEDLYFHAEDEQEARHFRYARRYRAVYVYICEKVQLYTHRVH